jgi:hypothetical protein
MKNLCWIIRATFRAAIWKSTPGHPSLTIRAVLFWMVVSMASDAAGEYFGIDGAAAFSLYGVNSIIAEAALVAGVAILFVSRDRAVALAQLFALATLLDWVVIAAAHIPSFELIPLTATAVLLADAPRIISRHRDIAFAQILTACVLADLAAIAAVRLPFAWPDLALGMWTAMGTKILLLILTFVWAIGAVAAILRGAGVGPYESPWMRAFGLCLGSVVAIAALPSFPTFVGRDFDLHSYNLWEIASAKFSSAGERSTAPRLDTTAAELSQPSLLEAEVGKLLPERKGTADIYAIGMAGWSEQDVFVKELNGGLAALERSIGMNRGAIRLVNHLDTIESLPVASPTNFASAVHSIAGIMNKDEDVLLIFITSHGGPTGVGLLLADTIHTVLSPDHVASVLDREGIKNRLLIVSACYSGVFVKRLASPNSVILTASDENSPSFGCSNEREWTYFGDALFNLNLRPGISLEESFENAKLQISRWEARDGVDPSNPQGFFGASLASKLNLSRGPVHRAAAEQ